MAKKAILDVLESTIGKYVRNLDAESLNVAVWKGNIQLNSLELDADAVNAELDRQAAEAPNLALPFKVIDGKFTKFEVVVPWSRITSRPVILRAKGLNVLVEPCDRISGKEHLIDVQKEEVEAKKIEESRLQSIERANESRLRSKALLELADLDIEDETKDSVEGSSSFGTRLVRRIVENLQLEINDVHVSLRGCGCSAGVVLESMLLATTDRDGNRTFIDRTKTANDADSSFLYKELQIKGLGLYLDEESTVLSLPYSLQEDMEDDSDEMSHSYILSPLSFGATLRQSDMKECLDFPKYLISSELSKLSILLTRTQLELGNKIAAAIRPSRDVARPLFPEYRPLHRVTRTTAKEWWKYAFRCIGRLNGRRSWVEFYRAFKKRQQYIPLYKRHAHSDSCTWLKALSPEEHSALVAIELDRSISREGIMTWRNIADAQVDKERRKRDEAKKSADEARGKSSYLSSFFKTSSDGTTSESDDDVPISLTVDEMKELEAISLEQSLESDVSADSRLYDLKFTLGAFKIDLIAHGMRQVASLDMGRVTSAFDANADGSFAFDLQMSSLEVHDKVTLRSLFPTVVQSLQSSEDIEEATVTDAFSFRLEKSKAGDQKLVLQMVAFQMVASSTLMTEMKKFFTLSKEATDVSASAVYRQNPMLAQSLSGTVDLFYDAGEGPDDSEMFPIVDDTAAAAAAATAAVSDQLSSALADAWKQKNKAQKTWTVDLDIHAPILVLPQDCVDAESNVLVFDLGQFSLKYGKIHPSGNVLEWFKSQPDVNMSRPDRSFDYGELAVSNLMFLTAKTGDLSWRKAGSSFEILGGKASSAIIEPVTLTLELGIASLLEEDVPKICMFGVLPALSFQISPKQVTSVFSVLEAWQATLSEMKGRGMKAEDTVDTGLTILEASDADIRQAASSSAVSGLMGSTSPERQLPRTVANRDRMNEKPTSSGIYQVMFARFSLRKLSINIATHAGDGLEAHLVAVSATSTYMDDGSAEFGLKMGWFWILDRLHSDSPRHQRLVAHSNLPRSASSFAHNDKYEVMEDLERMGVFEDDFSGSSELADITWKSAGTNRSSLKQFSDPFAQDLAENVNDAALSVLEAKFTSLYVQWNPKAIKAVFAVSSNFLTEPKTSPGARSTQKRLLHSPSGSRIPSRRSFVEREVQSSGRNPLGQSFETEEASAVERPQRIFVLIAEMESLEISLNSAIDDLPLFEMTMSETRVNYISSKISGEENMKASLILGDVRIEAPTIGKTRQSYGTLLGLAPDQSTSLLEVYYGTGKKSIDSLEIENTDLSGCVSCAKIDLSPMKLVYLHAQVMTLVEYVTEGILGAIFARAASQAKEVAKEIASSGAGGKIFVISATGFDLIIPKAAYAPEHFVLFAGDLDICYHSPPTPGVARAGLSLSEVSLGDHEGQKMVETPIKMTIDLKLPPIDVGSNEDQAMRIAINMSQAPFMFSNSQYAQLMNTLSFNVGEKDSFLRGTDAVDLMNSIDESNDSTTSRDTTPIENITHAGVAAVEQSRRMYVYFLIDALSVELCTDGGSEKLARVEAVRTHIAMSMIPDEEKMVVEMSLPNLVCEDKRLISSRREFQSLISQVHEYKEGEAANQDVFRLSYVKHQNQSSAIDLKIGEPQFVFIPDAVHDILAFFKTDSASQGATQPIMEYEGSRSSERVEVHISNNDGAIEASFEPMAADVSTMSFSVDTGSCRVILIDMAYHTEGAANSTMTVGSPRSSEQFVEAIVLRGTWKASLSLDSEIHSGRTIRTQLEMHGDEMEVFSAHGRLLESPLQWVDPVQFTIVVNSKVRESHATEVDVKIVTLSPIDMVFSMQNAALLNAILSSFSQSVERKDDVAEDRFLTEEEASRIEQIAQALEMDAGVEVSADGSVLPRGSPSNTDVAVGGAAAEASTFPFELMVKLTMPETQITFVNDLQGLDEALFRLTAKNLVAGTQLRHDVVSQIGSSPQLTFDCHANTSFLADYFDSSMHKWQVLLVKPWELTFNGARGISKRHSSRMSTSFDIESFPCDVSFSEQFLASLGAANHMWSVYSLAAAGGESDDARASLSEVSSSGEKKASAARSLITTLPYAVENHSGINALMSLHGESNLELRCPTGTIQYFRFEPPRGNGSGGKRLYGQDITRLRGLSLLINDRTMEIPNVDQQAGQQRRAHFIGDNCCIMTKVIKEGKTTVIHISSQVDLCNSTSVPFRVAVRHGDAGKEDVGVCRGKNGEKWGGSRRRRSTLAFNATYASEQSKEFGVPVHLIKELDMMLSAKEGTTGLSLLLYPCFVGSGEQSHILCGKIDISPSASSTDGSPNKFDVTCQVERETQGPNTKGTGIHPDPFVVQAYIETDVVDKSRVFYKISLEPRAIIANKMPVNVSLRTPMPHTFSKSLSQRLQECTPQEVHQIARSEVTHVTHPNEVVEIFTPGPSIAVSVKCADLPVGGTATGWVEGGWINLPLVPELSLRDPIRCSFPFVRGSTVDPLGRPLAGGSEFFVAENNEMLSETFLERRSDLSPDGKRTDADDVLQSGKELQYGSTGLVGNFVVTVCNYAVDHTGEVLFEQLLPGGDSILRRSSTGIDLSHGRRSSMERSSSPFSAFSSPTHRRRISLLPDSTVKLRMLHLTMEGEEGVRRSQAFSIDDVSICEGGNESMPIRWSDDSPSGFYAYRRLVGAYQSEIHVVPEFVVFNGSKTDRVLIRQYQGIKMILEPGKMAPIRKIEGIGLILSMDFVDLGVTTVPFPCGTLGLRMCVVKASDGSPLGSLAVQTVIGNQDSRLVVKLGQINYGKSVKADAVRSQASGIFSNDLFRFRIRWSELQLTLFEVQKQDPDQEKPIIETALDQMYNEIKPEKSPYGIAKQINRDGSTETWVEGHRRYDAEQVEKAITASHQAVAIIILHRFTVDFQRVFKEDLTASKKQLVERALMSPERSQLSVIVHNVVMKDCSPVSTYPIVFNSTSTNSFIDLCIRCRGSLNSDLVKVDLVELNLAHTNGKSEKILVQTSEEFVWKLLDVINRILIATAELAGVDIRLEWDDEQGGYVVSLAEDSSDLASSIDDTGTYTPPKSDKLYDIHRVTVSPFTMLLSFKRQPQTSRYKLMNGVRFAKLMNYFTTRLKFKIDKAELRFGRYEANNVKGPPDRLIEILRAYYVGKIKLKFVTLMTAVSIQDWKYLASRETGDGSFKEGDIIRLTGNLAGKGAGYIFKNVGAGIGDGLSAMTGTLGQGIENATEKVGAKAVGAGVNSVVTGVGDGVGSTIKGVGAGAGKVFKGAGKGVGQVFGGVTGGAQQIAKGVGKGVTEGDGRAVLSGLGEGVTSVGLGVGQGVESVVTGAADGVLAAGSGFVTGVKSIGKGIGGVFGGCGCGSWSCCGCANRGSATGSDRSSQEDVLDNGPSDDYHIMEE